MNRWSTIQLATNKFCYCFDQIERLNQSGLTEKDKVWVYFNYKCENIIMIHNIIVQFSIMIRIIIVQFQGP